MNLFKAFIIFLFLSIFANNISADVLIPNEEDKNLLKVFLIKNPEIDDPVFTKDIDNNLAISKNSSELSDSTIDSNACLLTNLSEIDPWDYLNRFYQEYDGAIANYLGQEEARNLYLVDSVYAQYGIENLAKILSDDTEGDIIDFAKTFGIDLKVNTMCKNTKTGNISYINNNPDLFFIPTYLYSLLLELGSERMQKITDDDVIGFWEFDEMKALSDNYSAVLAEEEKVNNELQEKFARLAEEKNKEYMGSLYINAKPQYGSQSSQNFCTLNYSNDDAVAVIGYRLVGDEMLIDKELINYFDQKEITLNYSENQNYFEYVFDDIGEAFLNIKDKLNSNDKEYCNFFIDYPENILRLKNAIARDVGTYTAIGKLLDKSITGNQYAIVQGFDDYDQYSFANNIDANYSDIKSLENYQIFNQSEYQKIQDDLVRINYSNDITINVVLTYLDDLSKAQQKEMSVIDFKNARVKEEERLAKIAREAEQKRQEEFAKEYPYTAILSCGMGGGDHTNIVACFVGGTYGVDTELEIQNGQDYQMYKVYNLSQAGIETYNGLEIYLRSSFNIKAQNSSEFLLLSLEIIDNATGMNLYVDSAAEFGVVSYVKY